MGSFNAEKKGYIQGKGNERKLKAIGQRWDGEETNSSTCSCASSIGGILRICLYGGRKCNARWKLSSCWAPTINHFLKWRKLWSTSGLFMERTLPSCTQKAWGYHTSITPRQFFFARKICLKWNIKVCLILPHGRAIMCMVTFHRKPERLNLSASALEGQRRTFS